MLEGTNTDAINSPYVRLSSHIHLISFRRAASKDQELSNSFTNFLPDVDGRLPQQFDFRVLLVWRESSRSWQ